MKILLDSWAWLEYFAGTPASEAISQEINGAEEIITAATNLFEVAHRVRSKEGAEASAKAVAAISANARVVAVDSSVALEAVGVRHEYGLHAMDALALAAARLNDAVLITGDPHFKGVKGARLVA
ncbi:MAG: PIN domain-containing protein [Candidatus Micrarchaeota archaeon]